MFLSGRGLKLEPISINLSRAQPFAFKGPHSQVIPRSLYKAQDINPNVGRIHMKQQTTPHVMEVEVTSPLKDKN